jgi:hypothetical protein
VPLKQDTEYNTVFVHCSPEPMSDAIDACTHINQMPPGTPTGFPVAKFIGEQRPEFDTPFTEGLVTDLDAALVEQFLNITVAQGETVVQPNRMLDDGHGEAVAVGLWVGHGRSAYPDPVKATQPSDFMCMDAHLQHAMPHVNQL